MIDEGKFHADRPRPHDKGIGTVLVEPTNGKVAGLGWNLLAEDLSLPTAVLHESRLQHNLDWMQRFISAYRLNLAPHGKTTMAPALFRRQINAGAWGMTLATAQQVRAAHAFGIHRIIMANQLVGRQNMWLIADMLADEKVEFFCLVDSAHGADLLGRFFTEAKRPLSVLIEIGVAGGRTGVRDEAQLQAVLDAVARWPQGLCLAGVEMYEGVLQQEDDVRVFLRRALDIAQRLQSEGRIRRQPAILSGAGSAWFDVVAEEFSKATVPLQVVLRPGCYLTHDVGAYQRAMQRVLAENTVAQSMGDGLRPALRVWAYVQSLPEPGRAIIGLGKRDAAFDAGYPTPVQHFRPGSGATAPAEAPAHWSITNMMDQHAYMDVTSGDDIAVGDMIGFDISHPCLTFDKWRKIVVVDDEYRVIDIVQTYF